MFKNMFKKKTHEGEIYAPISGRIVPIEEVPDPVFGEKMMGEGIAVIPTVGKVCSPVNGEIVQIPETKHAIGIRTEEGMEILVHVGLETVSLKGEGFTVSVETGETVSVGQPLIEFDLDYVREHAKDITPIVITNSKDMNQHYTMTEEKEAKAGETVLITTSDK